MMAENCARCGHEAERTSFHWGHTPWGCDERECRCLGYRTPEQQEAWEEAARLRVDGGHHRALYGIALDRLLELYP
jgi:hypothetical protein